MIKVDVVIVGGGISGLFIANLLKQQNISFVLFEKQAMGSRQSIHSQGIIHSGAKYNLMGKQHSIANNLQKIQDLWQQMLYGKGVIDLSLVKVLSRIHYLWFDQKWLSKLVKFFALNVTQAKAQEKKGSDISNWLKATDSFYPMKETVLDVPSLLEVLYDNVKEYCFEIELLKEQIHFKNERIECIQINDQKVLAQHYIFAMGEGFEYWQNYQGFKNFSFQLRPLKMVTVKAPNLPNIFAHKIQLKSQPVVSITSHKNSVGEKIWYLGGNIAEQGVHLSQAKLIDKTKKLMCKLFPNADLTQAQWQTYSISRAESKVNQNQIIPDSYQIQTHQNFTLALPTKLTFAPSMALELVEEFQKHYLPTNKISTMDLAELKLSTAKLSKPIWEL